VKLYVGVFKGYKLDAKEAWEAATELFWSLLALSLPITFPILYPLVQLYKKMAKK
jgi:hypothetical protein